MIGPRELGGHEEGGGPRTPPLGSQLDYLLAVSSASRGEYGSPPVVVFAQDRIGR